MEEKMDDRLLFRTGLKLLTALSSSGGSSSFGYKKAWHEAGGGELLEKGAKKHQRVQVVVDEVTAVMDKLKL